MDPFLKTPSVSVRSVNVWKGKVLYPKMIVSLIHIFFIYMLQIQRFIYASDVKQFFRRFTGLFTHEPYIIFNAGLASLTDQKSQR